MVDLQDTDCDVTLRLRHTLQTRSRSAAVEFAIKNLVTGYSSRSFLREVALLLKPLPPSGRGQKPQGVDIEYEMVLAYRQALDWGANSAAARKQVMDQFQPPFGDRQFRRKLASWDDL